jgi:hypothetical protein
MSMSESAVQAAVRLEYARRGEQLFRNNVGVLTNDKGQPVRYGLGNDSAALNRSIKSADLIGWRSFIITPEWVGHRIAQFVSREIKAEDWKPALSGAQYEREEAQRRWMRLVLEAGGVAEIMTGVGP